MWLGCDICVRFDAVDFDEAVLTLGTAPFRFLTEMDKRARRAIERVFLITGRAIVSDFEAHIASWMVTSLHAF